MKTIIGIAFVLFCCTCLAVLPAVTAHNGEDHSEPGESSGGSLGAPGGWAIGGVGFSEGEDVSLSCLRGNLTTNPLIPAAGEQTEFTIFFYNCNNGRGIWDEQLWVIHSRKMHVLVWSEDLHYFAHLHIEDFGGFNADTAQGYYRYNLTFPAAGRYRISFDARVHYEDAQYHVHPPFTGHFWLDVTGSPAMQHAPVKYETSDFASSVIVRSLPMETGSKYTKMLDDRQIIVSKADAAQYVANASFFGVIMTLSDGTSDIVPGVNGSVVQPKKCYSFKLDLYDAAFTKPRDDLYAWLNAPMHVVVFEEFADDNDSFPNYAHGHGLVVKAGQPLEMMCEPASGGAHKHASGKQQSLMPLDHDTEVPLESTGPWGPSLYTSLYFPHDGSYRVWAQFTSPYDERLVSVPFLIHVGEWKDTTTTDVTTSAAITYRISVVLGAGLWWLFYFAALA